MSCPKTNLAPLCGYNYLFFILSFIFFCSPARAQVMSGLDVLEKNDFAQLAGKRVGIITNHTGLDGSGKNAVDALFNSGKVNLKAIFSPEHGFRGDAQDGEQIENSTDPVTGLPIYSLYGKTLRPTPAMLKDIDVLVFDIQDVGARFYTYLATMGYCMEESAKRGMEFFVLDRPNPLNGETLEGPVLEAPFSFTGYYPVPVRHGLTAGETALLEADFRKLALKLTVIPAQGWQRSMIYPDTGMKWVGPSPNIPTFEAALMYPGIGCFESTNMSVGRGTDSPFTWFGAPWLDSKKLADKLSAAKLAGFSFAAQDKVPSAAIYKGVLCHGVKITILNPRSALPLSLLVHAASALRGNSNVRILAAEDRAAYGANVFKAVYDSKQPPEKIIADFEASSSAFKKTRTKYLLY